MAESILTLDTIVERRTIDIVTAVKNGDQVERVTTAYGLLTPGEFSILDFHQIAKRSERVQAMFALDAELSDEQVRDLGGHLDWLCAKVLDAPEEVRSRLSLDHKLAVLGAFTSLQRGMTARPAGETVAPQTPSIGESGSPAS